MADGSTALCPLVDMRTAHGPRTTGNRWSQQRSQIISPQRNQNCVLASIFINYTPPCCEDTTLFSALLTEGTECYHYHRGAVCFYCVSLSMTDGVTLFSNAEISQSQIISH
jgi:hypothetical protein